MLVADLKRSQEIFINNQEQQQTLVFGMGKTGECQSVQDVEEGEISDSASVEEISEEDFNKPDCKVSNPNPNPNPSPKPMVWTMRDLYKYPISRNYASGLYNLAWAQAVQNKPLDEILVMDLNNSDSKLSASSNSLSGTVNSPANDATNKVIIDDADDVDMEEVGEGEKEDGELEEGEIDLDLEVVKENSSSIDNQLAEYRLDIDVKESELERRINSIRETLETLTVDYAEKSFEELCSRLQISWDDLRGITLEDSAPQKDALVQLSISAMQTLHSVFNSSNHSQKEQNKGFLTRLVAHAMSLKPSFFSPKQTEEIEALDSSLHSPVVSLSSNASDKEEDVLACEKVNQNGSDFSAGDVDLTNLNKRVLNTVSAEPLNQNDSQMILDSFKSGVPSSRSRVISLPLLDLHRDHDADSLPSPTRETTPCLTVDKAFSVQDGAVRPMFSEAPETESSMMHHYETDALRAVSTYQQKFGNNSFLMSDRLPSPTPSEESDNGIGDTGGEVSSSSIVRSANTVSVSGLVPPVASSMPHINLSGGQGVNNSRNAGLVSNSNPILRASAKSRDPRLRFANSDTSSLDVYHGCLPALNNELKMDPLVGVIGSRKQKTSEGPVLDGPAFKRQRNESTESVIGDVPAVSGTGGWLEDIGTVRIPVANKNYVTEAASSDPRKLENTLNVIVNSSTTPSVAVGGNEQLPVKGGSTPASLHSLLKDIAVNPSMWMNIIKMEQQKSVDPPRNANLPPGSNSILGAVPSINVSPTKSSASGKRATGILQTPQMALADESGKVRMKPRDPRRVLHNNILSKGGNSGYDQSRTDKSGTQENVGNLNGLRQEDQSAKKSVTSGSSMPPDIARQFTKNLKNIADIISVTQPSITQSLGHQVPSPPGQVHPNMVDLKETVVLESGTQQSATGSVSEDVGTCPSQSQSTWGDVEHLFEGFDDQQKAAIQRERARRIEEQKKMFSARKLSLVLDLDHTLLNSAKFIEVDPVHDEMLRKKEEQDREKPQRHLFRFPHMGMWTKLRPGIWNFLEKASHLFELHLYTMGNKLYATEMAKVLDPRGDLFAGRVISRGDDGDLFDGDEKVPKSKDLEGVLGMESAVVIIDDSVRVWPHNKLNLIVVERYIYFPCSRRQFGLQGPSLLEIDHDERPEDGTLASSLAVIETIHQNFFSHHSLDEADVRNILASEQRRILAGCRIVFSRVFPVGEANPHLHPLWVTAEQFGAVCTNHMDEQVTHVVANSLGTDKVNWALSRGRFVVHPGWVEASALLYRRANELDFTIKS